MHQDLRKRGYDQEEQYFHKLNRQLLRKRRARSGETAYETSTAETSRVLDCPSCGAKMKPTDLVGVTVDRCTDCGAVFLDRGEVEALLEAHRPRGFIECVGNWF